MEPKQLETEHRCGCEGWGIGCDPLFRTRFVQGDFVGGAGDGARTNRDGTGIAIESLLAVDLGLRTGLALYVRSGRVLWYRSQNFGSRDRLRRGVHGVLKEIPNLGWLVLEGDRSLAEIWEHGAKGLQISVRRVSAEVWRSRLLYAREQPTGPKAKQSAGEMARKIIEWSGAPRPTSLRHDAAEAILLGLWGVLDLGWLKRVPPEVRR